MDIVHAKAMAWGENLAAHRQGGMAHKVLFEGAEGSPDNYLLVLAREGADYFSPRHRHAWDQVRYCLEGAVPLGRALTLDRGEAGYFPEGVPYGPQEGGPDRTVLLLQFGGASGLGYLSTDQLRRARAALAKEGVFEGGVFHSNGSAGKKNEDAYEAIWRQATGRAISYPPALYQSPIIMRAEAFASRPVAEAPGVRRKALGQFPSRGLGLDLYSLAGGARFEIAAAQERRFLFVLDGEGMCNSERYEALTAIRLEPGERAEIAANAQSELFSIAIAPVAPSS